MSNDLVQHQDSGALASAPYGKMMLASSGMNAGAVTIESERAIAEARGQIQLAKMFPRSVTASITEFLEACRNPEFAAAAFYSVPNRGSGPSIRFAEEAARCYGNFEYGHRELSRSNGKSEIEVYAWDKEKNNRSPRQITVMHVRDTRDGAKPLTDQADIDNRIANVASKQIRGRILALLPKHMIAAGVSECKRTLAGSNEKPLSARVLAVADAFAKYGITNAHLTRYLGHSVDETTADELADLIGIGNALKEGAKPSDYFGASEEQSDTAGAAAAITNQAKQSAATAKKGDREPAAPKSKPTESDSKPAKEARRESGHKDDTLQQGGSDEPAGQSQQPEGAQQGDDVF